MNSTKEQYVLYLFKGRGTPTNIQERFYFPCNKGNAKRGVSLHLKI
jgi:hypothetical protein